MTWNGQRLQQLKLEHESERTVPLKWPRNWRLNCKTLEHHKGVVNRLGGGLLDEGHYDLIVVGQIHIILATNFSQRSTLNSGLKFSIFDPFSSRNISWDY